MPLRGALGALVLCALIQQPPSTQPSGTASGTPSGQPNAATLLAQAVELHQAGDILGAIAAYEAALKLEPENAGAHSNLGAALVRLGRYDQAITHYRKATAIAPTACRACCWGIAICRWAGFRRWSIS
jgi:Flp pilus assembly protein TadD